MNLGVIPARGGSSLKDKNLRPLLGKPLIRWIVEAALASNLDRVVVSSDSAEIRKLAGCETVIRPPELAGDKSPSEDAVNHAIDVLCLEPEKTLLLQCTTPTTTPEDINAILDLLDEYDSVFMAWPSDALLWDGGPVNHDPAHREMRQDRMMLEEAGIYGWRGRVDNRFSGKVGVHVTERGIDINDEIDFPLAEVYLRNRQQSLRSRGGG